MFYVKTDVTLGVKVSAFYEVANERLLWAISPDIYLLKKWSTIIVNIYLVKENKL